MYLPARRTRMKIGFREHEHMAVRVVGLYHRMKWGASHLRMGVIPPRSRSIVSSSRFY